METFDQVKNTVIEKAKEAKNKMVEMGQEAKDLVREVAGKIKGYGEDRQDALLVLKRDHEMIAGLFDQIKRSDSAGATREGLFAQLEYELEAHMTAEEKLFYPTLQKKFQNNDLIPLALTQHDKIKQGLAALAALPAQNDSWMTQLNALEQTVQQHVQMEETDLFKMARQSLNEGQLQDLGQQINQEEQKFTANSPDQPAATGKDGSETAPK